jgi:hypothetical protein
MVMPIEKKSVISRNLIISQKFLQKYVKIAHKRSKNPFKNERRQKINLKNIRDGCYKFF